MSLRRAWRLTERAAVDHLSAWLGHPKADVPWMPCSARSPLCANLTVTDVEAGRVMSLTPRSKVAIVGGGSTAYYAPLDRDDWEIWSCNNLAQVTVHDGLFRADRWFELHDLEDPAVVYRRSPRFTDWLAHLPIPVYQFGRRDNPRSVEYPLLAAITAGRDYFGCTFAYQISLAMAEGFTTIGLYGADLTTAREATVERATVEWWLGYAQGRGITVALPPAYAEPIVRTGRHPYRYAYDGEAERATVEQWLLGTYAPTLDTFRRDNRPPRTCRELWRARVRA